MPQIPRADADTQFWDQVRVSLKAYLRDAGVTQKVLAGKLGIEAGTLNNFLKGHSHTLGGRAVALACTFLDLVCDGVHIGRLPRKTSRDQADNQLVLQFDSSFRFKSASGNPTLVLKKPPSRAHGLHLTVRRVR